MTAQIASHPPDHSGRRMAISLSAVAGIGYTAAWVASLPARAPNPSVAAPGSQVVAAPARRVGYPPHTIRLLADSTSTGGRLTAQWVTLLGAGDGANAHRHAAPAGGNGHADAVIVLALLVIIIAATSVVVASPSERRRLPRFTGATAGGLLAAYLVVRGIAEFFVINYSRPESYREDWGGPSLAGVLAVHSGPGLAILIFAGVHLYRWRRPRRKAASAPRRAGLRESAGALSDTSPAGSTSSSTSR
jgi:hypothetical protein